MGKPDGAPRLGPVAFGLGLLTDLTLPGVWEARPLSEPALRLELVAPDEIARRWSGFEEIGWEGTVDGARFAVERGRAGDYRFVHGASGEATRAVHHLSTDGRVLGCAPAEPSQPAWWRVVLDSVLFTVALLQDYEALHAAAVATPDGGALAIAAPMGAGKSTLLSELLLRGLPLLADDVVVLEPRGEHAPPLAHPAPPLMAVPNARLAAFAHMGATVCSTDDESWMAVPVHPEPLPLTALVVLDRRPGAQLSLTRADEHLAPLMSSLMSFPRTPARQRARFELASVLASHTSLWRLAADPATPPHALADTLLAEAHVSGPGARC